MSSPDLQATQSETDLVHNPNPFPASQSSYVNQTNKKTTIQFSMKIKPLIIIAASLGLTVQIASASDGKTLFETNCAKCHGLDGKGMTKMGLKAGAKDLTDAKLQAQLTDDKIAQSIKEGVKEGNKTKMKGFPDLSADDVKSLVAYVRSLKK